MIIKKLLTIFAFMMVSVLVFAQDNIYDIKYEVTARGITTIKNNKQIVGYALFFQVDKMRKSAMYRLVILDENLKEIGKSEFEAGKDTYLAHSIYESDNLYLSFYDDSEYDGYEKYVRVFNLKGKQVGLVGYEPEKVKKGMFGKAAAQMMESNYDGSANVEGKGMVRVYYSKAKTGGVDIQFLGTNGRLKWEKNITGDRGDRMDLSLFGTTPQSIMFLQFERSSVASKKFEMYLVGLSPDRGKEMFKVLLNKEGFNYEPMFLKATNDGRYMIVSALLDENDKKFKAMPLGIGLAEINDQTGEIKVVKNFTYKDDFSRVLKMKSDNKAAEGFIKANDLIWMNDGSMVLVGQFFKRTVSAGAVAVSALGGRADSHTQATIDDMFLLRISAAGEAVAIDKIDQEKARHLLPGDFMSVGLITRYLTGVGAFSYEYTDEGLDGSQKTVIAVGDRPGATYGTYAINIGETSGYNIKEFNRLKEKNIRYIIRQAKPGYVMVTKINKKDKTASLVLEKTE